MFYNGVDGRRNGIGIVIKEKYINSVLEVKRVSDRILSLKMEIDGIQINVISAYAPQVGCDLEEKEEFWSEVEEVIRSIPREERIVIGADFNGHIGEGNNGDEEVMGKYGVGERNAEGQMIVDCAKQMEMALVNSYFKKREEHKITYKSGGRSTQIDFILCRRCHLKEFSDCKALPWESVARQHRVLVGKLNLEVKTRRKVRTEPKIKWWRLKDEAYNTTFKQEVSQALTVREEVSWEEISGTVREKAIQVLGMTSGRRKENKETWWWNEEVQESIKRKKLAKQNWDRHRDEVSLQQYKEMCSIAKKEVAKAKEKAYDDLYEKLDTKEGEKDLYRLTRQRDRDGKDMQHVKMIKDKDGDVLTNEENILRRWKEYFEDLLNIENERERRLVEVEQINQEVPRISRVEVKMAMRKMKGGKAVGPDKIPVEAWRSLGDMAVDWLTRLFNGILEGERMPDEWRKSVIVPIFKNKGDVQSCSNYRGIKLLSHAMKICERVVDARLRREVRISDEQFGFMPGRSTTEAIFALRMLMEKYREGQKELHCVFIDLEKAYDRVPREEIWDCMRSSGVAEKYVEVVKDMYEDSITTVKCAAGMTEGFRVEVGLHQGSALSPFLFAIVMDRLTDEVRQESPRTMMFADDIVICCENREDLETELERWRYALERRGLKVSRTKTEYMCLNGGDGEEIMLQGVGVTKVDEFRYLGSTVQSNGDCGREVKKRVQAGWNGWRKTAGVICDRRVSARTKGKIHKVVVRPAMLYGMETVPLTKKQEAELEVAELKMLRFALGVTRKDKIRNDYIRGTAHVRRFGDKAREARLRWFGHVKRRDEGYVGRRMLDMDLPGRRRRGRPKRRFMDAVKEDMQVVGVTEEDAEDRARWRRVIRCGDP